MVHKFQEREDYNDFDPVPYQGGYDQAATYGALKPADKECGYPRSPFGVEPPVALYGNERNPYVRGHPGPSVLGGSSKPGAVYGGGRDRTAPNPQPNNDAKTGSGRENLPNGETSNGKPSLAEYNKPRSSYEYEVSEESGYRKLKSIYDEENSIPFYNCTDDASGYQQPYFNYTASESGSFQKPRPPSSEVDQYGYRSLFYGYGKADSAYRNPQPYVEEASSVYQKPFKDEVESNTGPIYGSAGEEGAYSGYGYGYADQGNYNEEASGYAYGSSSGYADRGSYNEEGRGYGYGSGSSSGYGGYWKKFGDNDPARFLGGSVYVEESAQRPLAPANRSSWW